MSSLTRGKWQIVFVLSILLTAALAAQAQVELSEIRIDQPSTDNDEYFELAGAAGTSLSGMTYLVIGDGSGGSGVVEAVVDLAGQSIPASGFFVAAEASFTLGTADLTANLNFENSDNVTHLLVDGFVGANGDDLDTNDDGVLDSTPWSSLIDCVGLVETVGSGDRIYCTDTVGPDGSFVPAHSLDCGADWEIGAYDPVGGFDTPGAANTCPQVSVEINEVRIDQPSTDNDEYFELTGNGGAALDGLTYLVIGDGAGASGVIESVVDLAGQVVPASGYFVAAEASFTLGTADLTTSLNFENSDNVTHLVVRDFTGANGADLDTNDDGILDSTPWSELVDCVALLESPGAGDQTYCAQSVGPDGSFVPAHAYLCADGWRIGSYDPSAGDDTPGAANDCAVVQPGGLVINEIDYDQPGTDRAEFIELYNSGASAIDLSAFRLELVNGSTGSPYNTINLPPVNLGPGEYYVVCGDAGEVFGCGLDVSPDSNLIQNGSPDAVALVEIAGAAIVDTVSYEGDTAAPYTEGSGSGLFDSSSIEHSGISRLPDGADTQQNNVDFSPRCATPGAANSSATSECPSVAPPQLVINEIDYDQPGSDTGEFIEIKNNGDEPLDLDGITLELVNGNGGLPYRSIALPAVSLAAGDYFVVCGNAANVAECDLDASPDSNLVQNGAPDAVALTFAGGVLDAVSYEGDTAAPYTEGSGSGLFDSSSLSYSGISRFPDGADTNQNNVDFAAVCITPGRANTQLTGGCTNTAPALEIWEIQGSGEFSPVEDQSVRSSDNVVTATAPNGFFMQTPATRADGDGDTSDGIFVFTGSAPAVAVGDLVDVTGTVVEFFGFTEFTGGSSIAVTGSGLVPAAVAFDAQVPSPDPTAPSCAIEFECYEGMLVEIANGTVTGANQRFNPDPIAEAYITAAPARTFREPGIEFPGLTGYAVWDGNPEVFELDPDKLGLPNQTLTAGSAFSAVGVIGYEFGGYELWPSELTVDPAPLPVAVRERAVAEYTVGTLNLFRLFDDADDPPTQDALGRNRDDTVVSTDEYARRLTKFAGYIVDVLDAPDVLAVQEAESLGVLGDLATAISVVDPGAIYTAYLEEGNDPGTIDVGFLVRDTVEVDAVTQYGFGELFIDPRDGIPEITHDRPPLLLEGRRVSSLGETPIKVLVVHARSLGSIDSPSRGVFVRQKRYEQGQSIAQIVQSLQMADPQVPLVVTGDFNAYQFSDGYVDLVGQIVGDYVPAENFVCETNLCDDLVEPNMVNEVLGLEAEQRYSFIFRGNAQALDHALTSDGLQPFVRGAEYGRGNADAAVDLINDETTVLRSTDHDGLVTYLAEDGDGDGVADDLDVCPGTVIPESVPTMSLGVNRWALTDGDGVFDTTYPNGNGPGLSFTIHDTGGCSCEQIIEATGVGSGHTKFGCSNEVMLDWVAAVNPYRDSKTHQLQGTREWVPFFSAPLAGLPPVLGRDFSSGVSD